MRRLEDKVALVTGAASGIGRATAVRLAEEGARVVCVDVQAEAVEETAKALQARGGDSRAWVCDVTDPDAIRSTVEGTVESYGDLHALCNIAGILQFSNTHDVALDDWNRILAVNLTGTFLMCRAAIPHLLRTRGAIVNIASTAALAGHPWTAAYSASKGGVLAFTRTLAIEYGKQGLRANALCPGAVKTPIHDAFEIPEGADPKLLERIMPFSGFADPEAVASAVAFLVSDDARHINGEEIRIDGGMLS